MKRFSTISEFHAFRQLPKPQHPLLSVVDVDTVPPLGHDEPASMVFDFYCISVKRMRNVNLKYGQHSFDFNEGIMSFMAPNQVFSLTVADPAEAVEKSGWVVYIHPDFLWNTPLAKTIQQHDFWDYSLKEALFLSAKEEEAMLNLILAIQQEYASTIDQFSKPIIVSHVQSLLQYADRFYHRQFLTREKANHEVLERLEALLQAYFDRRVLTGQNTQQHIHAKLLAKAKEKLSTTNLTVSEIAYELGFEHLQSFSKLFKTKTHLSPLAFRASFN
jgi:AraC-like DNA-binding protein